MDRNACMCKECAACAFSQALVSRVHRHKDELAAIIVEPLHRCTPPTGGFLHALRAAATEAGALLIFDEVLRDNTTPR